MQKEAKNVQKNQRVKNFGDVRVVKGKRRAVPVASKRKRSSFRAFLKSKVFWWTVGIATVVVVSTIVSFSITGLANTARFYPQTCLGDWENPHLAHGKPETLYGFSIDRNSSTVARLGGLELFCGSFTGEIPEDAEAKKASIVLSLSVTGEDLGSSAESDSSSGGGSSVSDEEGEELDIGEENTEAATSTSDESPGEEVEASTDTETPTSSENESVEEEPVVEEGIISEESAEEPEPEPDAEVPVEARGNVSRKIVWSINPLVVFASEATSTENGAEESVSSPDREAPLLEVAYTLDGSEWTVAGEVAEKNIFNGEARISMPPIFWEQISDVQVRVKSTETVSERELIVLIDSVWIEIEHEKPLEVLPEEETEGLLRIEGNGFDILRTDKTHFRADEDVEFEFEVPSLETATSSFATTSDEETEPTIIEPSTNSTSISGEPEPTSLPQAEDEEDSTESSPSPPNEPDVSATTTEGQEEVSASGQGRDYKSIISAFLSRFVRKTRAQEVNSQPVITRLNIFNPRDEILDITPQVAGAGNKIRVRIPRPENDFMPGRYRVDVEILQGDKVFVLSHEFTWGVLALNLNKNAFLPGEEAYIQMAALTDLGHTICDANLKLDINSPDGSVITYNTSNKSISKSGECGADNVTDQPDYFVYHVVGGIGEYTYTLTNLDTGNAITGSFQIDGYLPFEVERTGATRINPFRSTYKMKILLTANKDFDGTIVETIPASFSIESHNADGIEVSDGKRFVRWDRKMQEGEGIILEYVYQAPEITPKIFLLGPLTLTHRRNPVEFLLGAGADVVFQEARQWQIASDGANLLTYIVTTSSTGNAPGSWANMTDMSATVDVDGPDSVIILTFAGQIQTETTADSTTEFRFAVDSNREGPQLTQFIDSAEEGTGTGMIYATTSMPAGSYTFSVQWQNVSGTAGPMETSRPRSFQITEITSGASILINKAVTSSSGTSGATFATTTDMSGTATVAGTDSILLMLTGVQPTLEGDRSVDFRFAVDGVREGPQLLGTADSTNEGNGVGMAYATTSVPAGSHDFALHWKTGVGANSLDTGRTRTFQVLEFTSGTNLLVSTTSVAAQSSPTPWADVLDLSGTANVDGPDSALLMFANFQIAANTDRASDVRTAIDGNREGGQLLTFTDTTELAYGLFLPHATTSIPAGSYTFSVQWQSEQSTPVLDTGRTRSFQVLEFFEGDTKPNTPTLDETPAFPNMATATTPLLGGFAALDPDAEDTTVGFEIAVDDNFDFSSLATTSSSSDYPGEGGWTAATFSETATTSYKVQPNGLTDDTTYWWRVNAHDVSDTTKKSASTTPRSFTASSSLTVARWHQTTYDQFNGDTLSGVSASSTADFIELLEGGGAASTTYSTAGTDTFEVPAGVTELEIKAWGAGGGGGGGSNGSGGDGAGGGFAHATAISVTAESTLNVSVGGLGGGGTGNSGSGAGGGGGGHTGVFDGSITQGNALIMAGAGGGGGGGDNGAGVNGANGGEGGGNTAADGDNAQAPVTGGGGGDQSSGGAVGTGDDTSGTGGSALTGGQGDAHDSGVAGGSGGTNGGGAGGNAAASSRGGAGGGGAGYFGGGGGGGATAGSIAQAGGGGGSNFLSGTTQSNTQAVDTTGAGQGDGDYPSAGGVGDGGSGGTSDGNGTAGEPGFVKIFWDAPSSTFGTATSTEIDFDWVPNRTDWGEVIWQTTEPANTDVKLHVAYTNSGACDTLVPDGALSDNAAGFDISASPLDISGVSTTTYNRLCLVADLSQSTGNNPSLDEWTVTWEPPVSDAPTTVQDHYRWRNDDGSESAASWGAAEDVASTTLPYQKNVRLRFQVDNTGTGAATDYNYRLEWAAQGGDNDCDTSFTSETYAAVPDVATTEHFDMVTSSNFADGDDTTAQLTVDGLTFVTGDMVESTSNQTGNLTLASADPDEYTEVEFAFQANSNATFGGNYCFRVTNAGTALDQYDTVASTTLQQDPVPLISNLSFSSGNNLTLTENTFKWASSTMTVTDGDGCGDISSVTAKFYLASTSNDGTLCGYDGNDCYASACVATTTGNTCDGGSDIEVEYDCGFDVWYIAGATDSIAPVWSSSIWSVAATSSDGTLEDSATNTNETIEVISLLAHNVTASIGYGTVAGDSDTGTDNQTVTITNTGNISLDTEVGGDIMCTDYATCDGNVLQPSQQKYATSSVTYASLTFTLDATSSPGTIDTELAKSTSTTTPITDDTYWGIAIPASQPSGDYTGQNTLVAVADGTAGGGEGIAANTVSTASANTATVGSQQRKTWWDGSRYWVSFATSSTAEFWYSANGTSWSRNTNADVTLSAAKKTFSIEADSTNAFIAHVLGSANVNAREATSTRGYPGTTWDWGAPEAVFDEAVPEFERPVIDRDSSDILYLHASADAGSYAFRSASSTAANDVSGFDSSAYEVLDTTTLSSYHGVIVPLSSGNMYSLWKRGDTYIEGKQRTDGSGWGSKDGIASSTIGAQHNISAVSSSTADEVYLAYIDENSDVIFKKYSSSSWGSAVSLDSGTNDYVSISIDKPNDDLYVFWVQGSSILYKKGVSPYASGDWDGTATVATSTGTHQGLTTSYEDGNDIINLIWTEATGSPYDVRFIGIDVGG